MRPAAPARLGRARGRETRAQDATTCRAAWPRSQVASVRGSLSISLAAASEKEDAYRMRHVRDIVGGGSVYLRLIGCCWAVEWGWDFCLVVSLWVSFFLNLSILIESNIIHG